MYNLERFGFADLMSCRADIRKLLSEQDSSFSAAASRLVRYFRKVLVDESGRSACALVRTFITAEYSQLDAPSQEFARSLKPEVAELPDTRCLVLAATDGDRPEWCSPELSRGHRAIPLVSERMIEQAPMIAQLIREFGVAPSEMVRPEKLAPLSDEARVYNVFYVPDALGSPYIVAQKEFVEPERIRSVLAFGGMVSREIFVATILFSRVSISPQTADLFRVVGLNVRLALIPFARKPVFDSE